MNIKEFPLFNDSDYSSKFSPTNISKSEDRLEVLIIHPINLDEWIFTNPSANFLEIVNETRLLSCPSPQLLSRHHQSRPTRADASRIKLDGVQARLYVVRAGDARVRKSAGCAVSPVRVSRHSITSRGPFSRRWQALHGCPKIFDSAEREHGVFGYPTEFHLDPANLDPCHAPGSFWWSFEKSGDPPSFRTHLKRFCAAYMMFLTRMEKVFQFSTIEFY